MIQILTLLAWLAVPCVLIAVIDDWFLRPRRRLAQPPRPDPPLLSAVHYATPVLVIAAVLRLLSSQRLFFSLVLVVVVVVSGLIWLADRLFVAPGRRRAALAAGRDPASIGLPATVDYARSFFPVALIVLLIRAFLFEPFRIPSDSMMPTLVDGDFILVNKFAYGLRLPVLNWKFLNIGEPQRGDVVVFRYPPNPRENYIKRVVGLPGDHVQVHNDQIILNGKPVPFKFDRRYDDGCYHNMRLDTEVLGRHVHQVLSCLTPFSLVAPPGPTCNRRIAENYVCVEPHDGEPDRGDTGVMVVPPHEYLMLGDNRDNSSDSRYWGDVPEANLIGKAVLIWFNWDLRRSGGPNWSRIGRRIE